MLDINQDLLATLASAYNWKASLLVITVTVATVALARLVLFRIPAFAQTYAFNKSENRKKYKSKRMYPERISSSHKVAGATNAVFFLLVMPFITTFEAQPWWEILLHVFTILMVYDFFYYLTHRFLFHGQGFMRQVHAIHHQARNPTSLDALLLHPLEAFIGIALFIVVTAALSLVFGKFQVITMIATNIIYTQINSFNHVHMELDRQPYKLLNWIAHKHSIHHIDMHKGNYATITLFFDKVFGTLD
jgi:sterol desaturase/sphingolipid hydroxylase (fatty acid hydroxylase superfamily)